MIAWLATVAIMVMIQSALLYIVADTVTRLQRSMTATFRSSMLQAVLGLALILPILDVVFGACFTDRSFPRPTISVTSMSIGVFAPSGEFVRRDVSASRIGHITMTEELRRSLLAIEASALWFIEVSLLAVWALGAVSMMTSIIGGLVRCSILRRRLAGYLEGDWSRRSYRRPFDVAISERVVIPCFVGIFKPLVLLPARLPQSLTRNELAAVVEHEATHVQRFDDWWVLLADLGRAFAFYNPVVHIVVHSLALQREVACDDRAIEILGDKIAYASMLVHVACDFSSWRSSPSPGLYRRENQLVKRIEELLLPAHASTERSGTRSLLSICALTTVCVGTAFVSSPVTASAIGFQRSSIMAFPENVPIAAATYRSFEQQLATMGYAPVSRSTMKTLLHHRVDAAYVASMNAIAHRRLSPDALILLRDHRVDPEYIDSLAKAGVYIPFDFLISARDHRVDASFARSIIDAGMAHPTVEELVRFRDHDVTAAFIAEVALRKGASILAEPDELVRLRDLSR